MPTENEWQRPSSIQGMLLENYLVPRCSLLNFLPSGLHLVLSRFAVCCLTVGNNHGLGTRSPCHSELRRTELRYGYYKVLDCEGHPVFCYVHDPLSNTSEIITISISASERMRYTHCGKRYNGLISRYSTDGQECIAMDIIQLLAWASSRSYLKLC